MVRLSRDLLKTPARFDEPNLASRAGLIPVMALAQRAGLCALARRHVTRTGPCAANAGVKAGCLVAGMAAGADSTDDLDVLRHGATPAVVTGVRAPSTPGLVPSVRAPGATRSSWATVRRSARRSWPAGQGAASGHTKIAGKMVLVSRLNARTAGWPLAED